MRSKIFINYRRDDDPGFTDRLQECLAESFSADQLFMDIDSIEPGLDFRRVLEEQVKSCDVFLAVIGPRWLEARDAEGNRRLDDPDDYVRMEIELALKLEKRVIPVLVNKADMPSVDELPDSLKALAARHAVQLARGTRFKDDARALARTITKALDKHVPPPPPSDYVVRVILAVLTLVTVSAIYRYFWPPPAPYEPDTNFSIGKSLSDKPVPNVPNAANLRDTLGQGLSAPNQSISASPGLPPTPPDKVHSK